MDIKELISTNMLQVKEMFKEMKNKETRKKQIPNMLTLSRLLAPFVIIPCSIVGAYPLAFSFVALFSITDLLDGYIARKYNLVSEIGKNLDALADKLFAGTLLLSLVTSNPMFIVTFLLELIIGSVNIVQAINGNNPKSHMLGKVKATFLYVLVGLGFGSIYLDIPKSLITGLFLTTSVLQVQSAKKYCKVEEKDNVVEVDENVIEMSDVEEEKTSKSKRIEEYKNLKDILLREKRYSEQEQKEDEKGSKKKL